MKKNILSLFVLGTLAANGSYASLEDNSEEQILKLKEVEILNLESKTPQEIEIKKSLLYKMKLAKSGFKEWKESYPNHIEIRNEFKRISNRIQTQGTIEHTALKKALEICKTRPSECQSVLKSNIQSIYTNSEIPTYASKKGFSIVSSAYASGLTVNTCTFEERAYYNKTGGAQFFAGFTGADRACGLSFVGPGLGFISVPNHFQICVGDGMGVNVGVYASANAFVGAALGLTVGAGGVCQVLSFNLQGIGAFAGLIITDDFGAK